ncbi:hypothetical protein LB505_002899 [Fusarium chuoi]|nr:hypothetical protein LB505_002899 [Fusarium chuoi]
MARETAPGEQTWISTTKLMQMRTKKLTQLLHMMKSVRTNLLMIQVILLISSQWNENKPLSRIGLLSRKCLGCFVTGSTKTDLNDWKRKNSHSLPANRHIPST